jgi:chitin disaccharide deacetylase
VRLLVVNADDLGRSSGVNRGIVDCHERGIVTSASLMVDGGAAAEAVELAAEQPELGVGLHWDVTSGARELDLHDAGAVRAELERQLDQFRELVGREPTHVDSHHHVHRETGVLPVVRELVEALGIPLRGVGDVRFVGTFYARGARDEPQADRIGVPFLERLLREEVGDGWTELSCHPGYVGPGLESSYARERETEVRSLTDRRPRDVIDELGIRLVSFATYPLGPFPGGGP